MAVRADAEDLQVDTAGSADRRLVALPRGLEVGRPAVRDLHARGVQVQRCGDLAVDDGGVRLGVLGRDADVLVEREGGHPARVQAALADGGPEGGVDRERRGPGGEAEDGLRPLPDQTHDLAGGQHPDLGARGHDHDLHRDEVNAWALSGGRGSSAAPPRDATPPNPKPSSGSP